MLPRRSHSLSPSAGRDTFGDLGDFSRDDLWRFRLNPSSILGSIASSVRFSQPFCVLTFASASRCCSSRAICVESQGSCGTIHRRRGGRLTLDTSARRMTFFITSLVCFSVHCVADISTNHRGWGNVKEAPWSGESPRQEARLGTAAKRPTQREKQSNESPAGGLRVPD